MPDHDSIYHRLFSHPQMVEDLLQNFLDPELLKELDLSGMRRENTKFTAPTGQRRRGDIVWEIPFQGGGNLFVLLLLEFQSEIDEWMALRVAAYTMLLYQQLVDERKLKVNDCLPPVLPIVLFNGETRWNAPTSMRDLIRLPENSPLLKFQPDMQYYTIDEGLFPQEELKGRQSLTALLFRLEHPVSPESVVETIGDLATWFQEHPDGPPVKRLFHEFLAASLKRIKGLEDLPSIPEELLEVVNMLAARVEQWEKNIEQRGEQQGERIGEARMLLRQLQRRFGDLPSDARDKIAKADLPILKEWSLRILDAQSLEDVFES